MLLLQIAAHTICYAYKRDGQARLWLRSVLRLGNGLETASENNMGMFCISMITRGLRTIRVSIIPHMTVTKKVS